jgi:prepilin-type processing-associated H-X9-DG protein
MTRHDRLHKSCSRNCFISAAQSFPKLDGRLGLTTRAELWKLARNNTPARPFAFTLVELLVVVAIMVTLAALAFSASRNGIEGSRKAACASNLRQLSVALNLYKADTGKMPLGVPAAGWPIGRYNTPQMAFRALEQGGYIKDSKILFCPSGTLRPDPWWTAWGPNDKYAGYCYWFNYGYDKPSIVSSAALPRTMSDLSSSTIVASDIIGVDSSQRGLINHSDGSGKCTGGNILYGDGHVAWIGMNECHSVSQNGFDFWLPKQ